MFAEFNHLPEVEREIAKIAGQLVRAAALNVERGAKERAPVDTGFLRSTVYSEFHDSSNYGEGAGTPPRDSSMLDEIPRAEDATTAYVAVGANYGIYVELGTANMGAQPYLVPALEAERPAFLAAWHKLEEYLALAGLGVP